MVKENLKIIIVGHVDHGKSTLIGRLAYETNSLSPEVLKEIKKVSRKRGKDFEFAYLADQLEEERKEDRTIDTTQVFLKTRKRDYVIIDAPGHVAFIKNMITGATQAEEAILIVDVEEGLKEQTKRHSYILHLLGLKRLIVLINKMDLVAYCEERFKKAKKEILPYLDSAGLKVICTIPISAKEGDNISRKSLNMKWYKGPPLVRALNLVKAGKTSRVAPLRFPVQDIYQINGEKIIVGRVVSGRLEAKETVFFAPSTEEGVIKEIKVFGKKKRIARKGESVGLVLDRELPIARGEVLYGKGKKPGVTTLIQAHLLWISNMPLHRETTFDFRCATCRVKCRVERIERRLDSSTLIILEQDAQSLRYNEVGEVLIKTEAPVALEKFNFIRELGRFVLEDNMTVCASGIIM